MSPRQRKFLVLSLGALGIIVGQSLSDSLFLVVVSLILILTPIVNVAAATILLRASRRAPYIQSLSDRADDAIVLAFGSVVAAGIGMEVVLTFKLGRSFVEDALAIALACLSVPAISWLRTWQVVWRKGLPRDRRPEDTVADIERVEGDYHIRVQVDHVSPGALAPVREDDGPAHALEIANAYPAVPPTWTEGSAESGPSGGIGA